MTAVRMTPWGSSLQCQQGRVPAEPKSVFGSVKLNRDSNVTPPQANSSAGGQEDLKNKQSTRLSVLQSGITVIRGSRWIGSQLRQLLLRRGNLFCCLGFPLWKTIEKNTTFLLSCPHEKGLSWINERSEDNWKPGGSQRQTLKKWGRWCLKRVCFQGQWEKQCDPDRKRWEETAQKLDFHPVYEIYILSIGFLSQVPWHRRKKAGRFLPHNHIAVVGHCKAETRETEEKQDVTQATGIFSFLSSPLCFPCFP